MSDFRAPNGAILAPREVIFIEKHMEKQCFLEITIFAFPVHFGTHFVPYDPSWGRLWAILRSLWPILRPSWGSLEPSWRLFGLSWSVLGAFGGTLRAALELPKTILRLLSHLGAILEPSECHFATSWLHFGSILEHHSSIWGHFWSSLGLMGSHRNVFLHLTMVAVNIVVPFIFFYQSFQISTSKRSREGRLKDSDQ